MPRIVAALERTWFIASMTLVALALVILRMAA